MSSELDQDMLATLTDEEREAIESDDLSEEERAALKNIAGDDDDEDDDDDDGDEDQGDGKQASLQEEADPKPAPAVSDEPVAAAADEAPAPAAEKSGYQAPLPTDYDEQIKTLKDRDAELRQRFKNGEIDIDERDAGLAALAEERESLLVARTKAEIAAEMRQQTAEREWRSTVTTFMKTVAKNEGIDYAKDEARAADLDLFVKRLAQDERNADKPMEWFLTEAHKRVNALYGSPAAANKPASKDEVISKRKPDMQAVPKTLAQVPGSDGPGDVGSEFAELDQLEGDDLEAAIARMSPAQRAKFASGG